WKGTSGRATARRGSGRPSSSIRGTGPRGGARPSPSRGGARCPRRERGRGSLRARRRRGPAHRKGPEPLPRFFEDPRDDPGDRLDPLREDSQDEIRPVGKNHAGHEVVDVVGVAGLRPETAAGGKLLAREPRVLELEVLVRLDRRDV